MSTRTFQPSDPRAAPFEELRLQNMRKPEPRPEEAAPKNDEQPPAIAGDKE